MKLVQSCLHCGGHHEVGAEAIYTVGVTMKRLQSFLHCGGHHEAWVLSCLHCWGHHEAGAKLFTQWGSP